MSGQVIANSRGENTSQRGDTGEYSNVGMGEGGVTLIRRAGEMVHGDNIAVPAGYAVAVTRCCARQLVRRYVAPVETGARLRCSATPAAE